MTYDISAGTALGKDDLYEGRTVCLADVATNPNNVGILERHMNNGTFDYWTATINNITHRFDNAANCLDDNTIVLYSLVLGSGISLDVSTNQAITRGAGSSAVTTTLSTLTPKDQFAICALEALIGTMPNASSMDDATILMLAVKSYKISQAMLYVGTLARSGDATPSGGSTDPVNVDSNNLNNDIAKILYNLNENIKVIKEGIRISDGQKVLVDNPTNSDHTVDKFQIEGGGGGGISYNDIPLLTETGQTTMSHVLGFATDAENHKYVGKLTFATFAAKIWTAITNSVQSLIDSRGQTNIASGGAWYTDLVNLIDSRITTKVKSEALNP